MLSQGEIEAAVCDGVVRCQSEYMGRGPRTIHGHLLGTLLVVRLEDALTPAERRLVAMVGGDGAPGDGVGESRGDGARAAGHGAAGNGNGNGNGMADPNGMTDGRLLLKRLRSHLVTLARPRLTEVVEEATGVRVVSVHHDISTVTGEEVLVFSLAAAPVCRRRRGD